MTPAVVARAGSAVRLWRNALFVIFALCGVFMGSWASRVPTISAALHLSTAQLGLLLFGVAIGSICGLIASGHLVAHFGAKTVIRWVVTIASVAIAFAAFGAAYLHSFPLTFAPLIIFGASFGTCDVAMNVSGAANEQALGRSIMPIYHAFFSVGTIIGAGIGAAAEELRVPLELHISAVSILAIIVGLIAVRRIQPEFGFGDDVSVGEGPADGEAVERPTWRARLSIWRDPRTILIGLIVLGMAFTEGSANDWLSYAMVHGHGTSRATGAVVLGVFVVAMTVGRFAGVRVLDRFGRVPVLRGTAILAGVGLLLFIFVPVFWVDILGVALWGLGASLGFPVGMSAAADDPHTAAARVSAVATVGYVAFLVGPPSIGFLGNQFGILHGLLLVLVLAAVAGLLSFAAREHGAAAIARSG